MIILHRISSVAIALVAALGFMSLINGWLHPIVSIASMLIIVTLLLARLNKWQIRQFSFWHLTGTPLLFLTSALGMQLFLESTRSQWALAAITVVLLFVFSEHIFSFVHLPATYQPFTLEYLSGLLHILSIFSIASVGFGLRLFLQMPLWLLSIGIFAVSLFAIFGTLWVGKLEAHKAKPYAITGAILLTECFAALSFLPSGFYTNAALLALVAYVFLGLARANALHKLTKDILRRYIILFILLTLLIAASSAWL